MYASVATLDDDFVNSADKRRNETPLLFEVQVK